MNHKTSGRRGDSRRQERASTAERSLVGETKANANQVAAERVGKAIAERSLAKNLDRVVFDRGGFLYHGKMKALADAARAGGLKF